MNGLLSYRRLGMGGSCSANDNRHYPHSCRRYRDWAVTRLWRISLHDGTCMTESEARANFPRGIFYGTTANIAGMTVRRSVLAYTWRCPRIGGDPHSQRSPCLRHDPHSRQSPCFRSSPKLLAAALTTEQSVERNVDIRHVSRESGESRLSSSRF